MSGRLLLHRRAERGSTMTVVNGVAVEKGTKSVISANFRACGERTFNNLRTNFAGEIP